MRLITIDSSVFVSAARPTERGNMDSALFLAWVRRTRPRVFVPTLVIAEVATALSRTGSDAGLAEQYALAIGQLPNIVFIALDETLARQAAALGARHKLRGADAVYLATAAQFAAELITLDAEQLTRSASIVQALSPAEFLAPLAP